MGKNVGEVGGGVLFLILYTSASRYLTQRTNYINTAEQNRKKPEGRQKKGGEDRLPETGRNSILHMIG